MTDGLESLKLALADRYTIERELGAGGMATQRGSGGSLLHDPCEMWYTLHRTRHTGR